MQNLKGSKMKTEIQVKIVDNRKIFSVDIGDLPLADAIAFLNHARYQREVLRAK